MVPWTLMLATLLIAAVGGWLNSIGAGIYATSTATSFNSMMGFTTWTVPLLHVQLILPQVNSWSTFLNAITWNYGFFAAPGGAEVRLALMALSIVMLFMVGLTVVQIVRG